QTANAAVVQNESFVVLNDLPKNSNSGKLVEEIKKANKEIEELNGLIHKEQTNPEDAAQSFVKKEEVTKQLQTLQKRQAEILLTIEQTEPAVFQALTIPPLDLQSSRNKLNKNDV